MKKVSVVIPVYNSQKYLERALNSVRAQSLGDIEIICVDDGSTDDSLEILNRYAQLDSRIIVLHQKNQYAGVARNNGLHRASGKYVYFMDSDDFIEHNLLELTYEAAEKEFADIVLFGGYKYFEETQTAQVAPWYLQRELLPKKSVFNKYDVPESILEISKSVAPWCKLYNREFVLREKLEFQALSNTNDAYFTLTSIAIADRIVAVDKNLVYYNAVHEGNTTGQKFKHPLCFLEACKACYYELERRGIYGTISSSFEKTFKGLFLYNKKTQPQEQAQKEIWDEIYLEEKQGLPYIEQFLKKKDYENNTPVSSSAPSKATMPAKPTPVLTAKPSAPPPKAQPIATNVPPANCQNEISVLVNELHDYQLKVCALEKSVLKANNEIDGIRKSLSYRIGRFFTWLPRKIRGR